ncbi:hypothetical protein QE438_002948 [Pseudoxanthomonas sp. SORGH_AS 997]|nr:hypothetical protein [Pseudoxanthomonas sp. SORGH_AS_0997]
MGAVAGGQHQHGLRPVDAVAGGDLVAAGLQEVGVGGRFDMVLRAAQHREDGAHRDVDVDVGAAVQRVEQQQELAVRILVRHRHGVVHLLRGAGGQVAAPGVGFQQDVVADHVQLLLRLALHVAGAGLAQHAAQRALAHRHRDAGAGAHDDGNQLAQFGADTAGALFFDQVAGQGDGLHRGGDLRATWGPALSPQSCDRGYVSDESRCPATQPPSPLPLLLLLLLPPPFREAKGRAGEGLAFVLAFAFAVTCGKKQQQHQPQQQKPTPPPQSLAATSSSPASQGRGQERVAGCGRAMLRPRQPQITRSVIALSTARVRSRVPSLSRITDT